MDLTDTIKSDSQKGATEGVPTLPSLPATPALPTLPPAPLPSASLPSTRTAGAAVVSPMSVPPLRSNLAANASYGAMPSKPRAGEPSPAALRAAELRRQAKKRRRVRRVAMLVVAIAVGVLAGPPLVTWIADGFDTAGSTETESPPAGDQED